MNVMSPERSSELVERLEQQLPEMLEHTVALCEVNSGSDNRVGIETVNRLLENLFEPVSDVTEYRPLASVRQVVERSGTDSELGECLEVPSASMLLFRCRPDAPLQFLFTGHSDTVFPLTSDFQRCWREGNHLHGPGTADMKGGLVVLAYALKQLEWWLPESMKHLFGFTLAISPDEETGSLASGPELIKLAQHAHIGLTYEPALADGSLAGARKGSGNFTLLAKGVGGHAGRDFFNSKNALVAMAEVAVALSRLSDEQQGISVNIGRLVGGDAVNKVPDQALCRFNVRVLDSMQQAAMEQAIQVCLAEVGQRTGCAFELHGGFNRPPKPMSKGQQALFELAQQAGESLGLNLSQQPTGGCCEGNNLASAGLVNLDTLGVRGYGIHTTAEYACIDSFVERAALSALLIEKVIQAHRAGRLPCLRTNP